MCCVAVAAPACSTPRLCCHAVVAATGVFSLHGGMSEDASWQGFWEEPLSAAKGDTTQTDLVRPPSV